MGIVILLFSGCGAFKMGEFKISGRVTEADGGKGIRGVRINYKINNYSPSYTSTPTYNDSGEWSIWADEGDKVTIWAEKDHYMFQPAPLQPFTVSGSRNDVNFQVIGWSDNFSNSSSGWDIKEYDDGSHQKYVPVDEVTKYEIKVVNYKDQSSFISTLSPLSVPSDYTVEATMYEDNEAEGGTCGLVFNVKNFASVGELYNIFRIRPDEGKAEFLEVEITSGGTVIRDLKTKTNADIDHSNTTITSSANILKVVQNYNYAYLYVNGVEVWPMPIKVQDSDFLRVGLFASADPKSIYNSTIYHVYFDDFKLSAMGFAPRMQMMSMGINSLDSNSLKGMETIE